jgi:hypothetical protein
MPDEYVTRIRSEAVALTKSENGEHIAIGSTTKAARSFAEINGQYREVQEVWDHSPEAVDVSGLRSVLHHHDRSYGPIGTVKGAELDGERSVIRFAMLPGAKLPSGVEAETALAAGAIAGVSMASRYRMADTEYDAVTNTLYVRKWRAMELTLTSTPEDTDAYVVRSADENHPKITTRIRTMPDNATHPEAQPVKPAATDHSVVDAARAAATEDAKIIAQAAHDAGLNPTDYVGKDRAAACQEILAKVMERQRAAHPDVQPGHAPVVTVNHDEVDKLRSAAEGFLAHRSGFKDDANVAGNPLIGRRFVDAARRYAAKLGLRGAEDWSDKDAARFALGDFRNMERAANITTASFPLFVNLNAITKIVARGFEQGASAVNYDRWTERQVVPDFKQFSVGMLGTGNLQETAENVAFPELAKSEGVYNSAAKMWGGTLSLTVQALANDDTREFDRSLRNAGAIAQKTINRRAHERLMGASWTGNTTAGAIGYTTADLSYAARANLDTVVSAMLSKTGKDGNPLGNMPRYLLAPPALAGQARGIVNGGVAPGQATNQDRSLEVIESPWLSAAILAGNSATSYYLISEPSEATCMMVSFVRNYESLQVEQFDGGAAAVANWKIWIPFEADRVAIDGIVAGGHRGT